MSAEKIVNEITEFKPFETNLAEFKGQYIDIVYDLSDDDQMKKAKSDKLSIGKVISALDKKHKELKAPLKAKTDLIDHERKRIKDELLEMQGAIKHQLEQHEFKKAEHDAKLFNMVKAIEDLAVFGEFEKPDSGDIQIRYDKAKEIEIDDSYDHRKADAALAKMEVTEKLKAMLDEQIKYEDEQAELKRLQEEEAKRLQAEREEEIRKEAEEKAKKQAEDAIIQAEQQKEQAILDAKKAKEESERLAKEAEERAESERVAAAELAAKQERERIEAEQAEKERIEAESKAKEDAKKAKQAHRAKIHKAAKESFVKNGIDEDQAVLIINLIKDDKIDNINIEY